MLVVDTDTLRAIHLLHLLDEERLRRALTENAEDLLRIHHTGGQLLSDLDVFAVLDAQTNALRNRVGNLGRTVIWCDDQLASLLGVLDANTTGCLGDRCNTLRRAGLEEFLHTRQTVRDVLTCDTAGVERTHRELGTRLTDRLGSDDADGLTDFNRTVRRERAAVAEATGALLGVTREHRAHLDAVDPVGDELIDESERDVVVAMRNDFATRRHCVFGKLARDHGGIRVVVLDQRAIGSLGRDDLRESTIGIAIHLTNDHVLRHVDETTREVARVRGTECGVRTTLARTVRRDEVLEH